jgi:hypothetical protein
VFLVDLWLLVRNVPIYLAWRRKVGTEDHIELDLAQLGTTSPPYGPTNGISAAPHPGNNLHMAETATAQRTAGDGAPRDPMPATAAAAAPRTGPSAGTTTQALTNSMCTGLVVQSFWYGLFSFQYLLLVILLELDKFLPKAVYVPVLLSAILHYGMKGVADYITAAL